MAKPRKKPAAKKPPAQKPAAKKLKRHDEVALAFGQALVNGDFALAHSYLAPSLKRKLTPSSLKKELAAMSEGYAEGPPMRASLEAGASLETWPNRQPNDIGWSYVAVEGDDFVEAISAIVCDVSGVALIREIEWGRP